ncbi:MAG: DNA-binding response regulator [Proteobacteria bacterium]|nr:MAG: DNA-binding response regulator [Pseudomonadota bacterium]QKK10789.1 MAG: response regulator transcription factor [Pseudomonadota bacterium]
MSEKPIVFVVDDDEAARDSLGWLVRSVGLEVVTSASAAEFLKRFDPGQPGCLILDIRMPGMSGLELLNRLQELHAVLPVIIITGHGDVPMAVRALKAGAMEFIEKPFNDQELLDCVHRGIQKDVERRITIQQRQRVIERYEQLTPREREVMSGVVEGLPNKVIGRKLDISVKTVEAHRARIMEKMQASSLSQLVRMALTLESHASESSHATHA